RSGTDRVHEVARQVPADVYINVQGDLPLARTEHLEALLRPMSNPQVMVSTIKTRCRPEDVNNTNVVKVVTAKDGRALYFSRCPIPFNRDRSSSIAYYKHLGFYAYRAAA